MRRRIGRTSGIVAAVARRLAPRRDEGGPWEGTAQRRARRVASWSAPLVAHFLLFGVTRAAADFVAEVPGLVSLPPDARAAALGGSGVASAENAAALVLNPAAMALVGRGEITASMLYQRQTIRSGYFGLDTEVSRSSARLGSAGFVYPIAVYRGALSLGGLFHRDNLFDREIVRGGSQPGAEEHEALVESGAMDRYTAGAGLQISPSAFVGVSATIVGGSLERESDFEFATPESLYAFHATSDMDLSGFTGSFGALFFPSSRMRFGLRLDLPTTIEYEGVERRDPDSSFPLAIRDKVRYPLSLMFGGAGLVGGFLVSADVGFTPYSLVELNGARLRTSDRREGYRDLAAVGVGVERVAFDVVRLRLGYRYEPEPYRLVLAEVRDDAPTDAVMEDAVFEKERQVFSGGAGVLLEDALMLDVGADFSRTEKAGTHVDQSDDTARFYLTTSYRF